MDGKAFPPDEEGKNTECCNRSNTARKRSGEVGSSVKALRPDQDAVECSREQQEDKNCDLCCPYAHSLMPIQKFGGGSRECNERLKPRLT